MKALFSALLLVTASFLISSCGLQGAGTPIFKPIESRDPPAQFKFADERCQARRELNLGSNHRLGYLDLFLTEGNQTLPTRTKLNNIRLESSVRSELVKETVYGTKYERLCDRSGSRSQSYVTGFPSDCPGSDGYRAMVNGSRIKVCRKLPEFDRDSIESAALNSLHLIDRAYQFFKVVTEGRKIELPKILLEIFPEYGSVYKRYDDMGFEIDPIKKFLFHNVLYWPHHNTISVMPESSVHYERMQLSSQPYFHLWESSFVLAHELGHHIQFTLAANIRFCPRAAWNAFKHEFVAMNDDDTPSSEGTQKKLAKLCSGMSEAFADLFSHYSLEGSSTSYEANNLLFPARSAESEKIDSRAEKILSHDVLEMFLDKGYSAPLARRVDADFTDAHMVGAVFAHAINKFFAIIQNYSDLYEENPHSPSTYQKLYLARARWLLDFLSNFKSQEPPIAGPQSSYLLYLKPISQALELTLTESIFHARLTRAEVSKVKEELCQKSQELLPEMPPVFEAYCR